MGTLDRRPLEILHQHHRARDLRRRTEVADEVASEAVQRG